MKKTGVVLFLVAVVGIGAYLLLSKNSNTTSPATTTVPTQLEEQPNAMPSVDVSDLQAGGNSYMEANGIYNFLYPSDFALDESDKQHIRIYKTGSTQKGQTEMYDGVLLVFEVITLNGKSLSDWVDTHITTITADGTSELTEAKKEIKLKDYSGFQYSTRGLGESKNYIFQKDAKSGYAVLISTAVYDPGNVGFQNEVDKVFSTLQLFK